MLPGIICALANQQWCADVVNVEERRYPLVELLVVDAVTCNHIRPALSANVYKHSYAKDRSIGMHMYRQCTPAYSKGVYLYTLGNHD